jgi:hypothetical protein
MQNHHVGSGRRRVIPLDWSDHHRGLLDSTRDATVTLRRPGGSNSTFDPGTGTWTTTASAVYYTGPARIQLASDNDLIAAAGEQDITTVRYAVMLDDTVTSVQIEDICTVTAMDDNGDPSLVGRNLTVEVVARGSLHWERRLICTDNIEVQGT